MKKKIVCRTFGGFANRLRPIISIIRLAKKYNRTPHVNWPVNNHCMLEFGKTVIIDSISNTQQKPGEAGSEDLYAGKNFGFPSTGKICCVNNTSKNVLYIDNCYKWIFDVDDMVRVRQHSSYLDEHETIAPDIADQFRRIFRRFEWSPEILKKVSLVKDQYEWSNRPMGVHVRRTDKIAGDAVEVSRLDKKIFREIERHQDDNHSRIFLATDCMSTLERYRFRFGKRLVCSNPSHFDKFYDGKIFRSTSAVEAGNVDFLLLSHCSLIIGSKNSTYSSLAAFLGEVPLVAEV